MRRTIVRVPPRGGKLVRGNATQPSAASGDAPVASSSRRTPASRQSPASPRTPAWRDRHAAVSECDWLADIDTRAAMIQALIPIALEQVYAMLQQDVERLAGRRYQHGAGQAGYARWGRQAGSVYLGDQKVPIQVPRVRDLANREEVTLSSYRRLRNPQQARQAALTKVLKGLSCRDYASCVDAVDETFGLSASTISGRFRQASAQQLKALAECSLADLDLVAIFLDGKTFGAETMVIALGVTIAGTKVPLGFVQTSTENKNVCTAFLSRLIERGLSFEQGLLCVIDGGKGLRAAVQQVFGAHALVQRCQWHKRENVVSYLPVTRRREWRRKLQKAYGQPTYALAKAALGRLKSELREWNESAAESLQEGLEETLTLHRLGLFPDLGRSFKTTNCIESLNAMIEQRTGKVDYWKNSNQMHRWLAAALQEIRPRLNDVTGSLHLPRLRAALQAEMKHAVALAGDPLGATTKFN